MRILVPHTMRLSIPSLILSLTVAVATTATAQPVARPSDVESPEAVVTALYQVVTKKPGDPFQWDRFRTLFVPGAQLLPNIAQSQGVPRQYTVDQYIALVDSVWSKNSPIGSPRDRGFVEREIHARWEKFGDIAHVFSTYEKKLWTDSTARGRGINTIQLVRRTGRWWVVGMAWDEATPTMAIPPAYLGAPPSSR